MKKRQNIMLLSVGLLFLALMGLTIAYATMSETLRITGTANFEAATWSINFKNLTVETTGDATYELPTVSDTSLTNYSITLTKPGDSVTFNFDVENSGTIDAVLGTLSIGTPQCVGTQETATEDASIVCGNLSYTLKYADASPVSNNDLLNKSTSKTMKLNLTYNEGATQLPTNTVIINGLDINIIYNQN